MGSCVSTSRTVQTTGFAVVTRETNKSKHFNAFYMDHDLKVGPMDATFRLLPLHARIPLPTLQSLWKQRRIVWTSGPRSITCHQELHYDIKGGPFELQGQRLQHVVVTACNQSMYDSFCGTTLLAFRGRAFYRVRVSIAAQTLEMDGHIPKKTFENAFVAAAQRSRAGSQISGLKKSRSMLLLKSDDY